MMNKYEVYIKFSSGLAIKFDKLYKWDLNTVFNHEIKKLEKKRIDYDELSVTRIKY
jgi:hypothetical protein